MPLTKGQQRDRARLIALFKERNPGADLRSVKFLVRLSLKLRRYYLQGTNGPQLTEADHAAETAIENMIAKLLASNNLAVEFNSDPRGPAVFVHVPGAAENHREPSNDIGGRGLGIW